VNFLSDPLDGRSTLMLADVMVYVDRRNTCMCEFEWGFTTRGIGIRGFYGGTDNSQSCFKHSGKIRDKTCYDNQHVFMPFVFDIFGFLTSDVVDILRRVQKSMHNNVMSHKFMNVVF